MTFRACVESRHQEIVKHARMEVVRTREFERVDSVGRGVVRVGNGVSSGWLQIWNKTVGRCSNGPSRSREVV